MCHDDKSACKFNIFNNSYLQHLLSDVVPGTEEDDKKKGNL